jgi:hypothetical protein
MNAQLLTMKGYKRALLTRTFALSLATGLGLGAQAMPPLTGSGMNGQSGTVATPKAAGCSPATQIAQLDFNNVRAVLENGGNKWTRRGVGRSGYEVPKTVDFSGANAIYAGALWMGGVGPDGNLKVAAVLYRANGNDFWPGPLTNDGLATVNPEVCSQYDRFYTTTRAQAEAHVAWKNCNNDPDCLAETFPNGYSVPTAFINWPAMGNVEAGQDLYLAPFFDFDGSGDYDPFAGDYPDYGFEQSVEDCKNKLREDPVPLFGDFNIWWIFNDKGDAHTESLGQPIGLEVRAQGFAFSSNDEINNMTFYNYTVINQGSQTLLDTYFGHFIDPDLGCSNDDFTGCDVKRGLGYAYNWDDNDEACLGAVGYGAQPPAVGVDFFEGPFKDADGADNPGPEQNLTCQEYQAQGGIPYAGIGIGYGDDVLDNERFGMRAFIYFNRESTNANMTDPENFTHFYNYLRSIWKNNLPQTYGGIGYDESPGATRTFYMFPDESDPVGWGTNCVPQDAWREEVPTPAQPDRRFVQSAGPFTLEPGAYNNITVGVVWARANAGGAAASLGPLRVADDKAQALFDNCFKILDGPDAPDITIQELDRELILYLTNPVGSNNENEAYQELQPLIPEEGPNGELYDRFYRFQGYKVYQVKDATVSVADLGDVNLARLVYQGDVEDEVGQLVNFFFDETIQQTVPREMVNGANDGITHAIRITEDKFAQGDPALVNFKSYYYIALAYGYNNYEPFNVSAGTGQAFPYVESRKAAFGSIRSYVGIPHKPGAEANGTVQAASFGDNFQVTRLEGQGNGGLRLELTQETENAIMAGAPWRKDELKYKRGASPIDVKVVDPLKVPSAQFEIWFKDSVTPNTLDDAYWFITKVPATTSRDTVWSDRTIAVGNEQLILDWGLAVTIEQAYNDGDFALPVGPGSLDFGDDSKAWFLGIPDGEGANNPFNWIRSGTAEFTEATETIYNDRLGKDNDQIYEGILGGTWAPWPLVGQAPFQPGSPNEVNQSMALARINETPSVQLVITSDKSKWTRSPVLEQEADASLSVGGAAKLAIRASASIDKNGVKSGQPGCNEGEAQLTSSTGMGWFPGYAIDLETGERLNIAYGENSFWGGEIGRDMRWNPNDQLVTNTGSPFFGGCHWIYVFKNDRRQANNADRVPKYDEGAYIMATLPAPGVQSRLKVFRGVAWVGGGLVATGQQFLSTDVRINLSVAKPYRPYVNYNGQPEPIDPDQNAGLPLYTFGTGEFATQTNVASVANEFLDRINVVPNPYYAFSGYETSRLDNRIKFINLPQSCTISIYTVSGTLVRKFRKDNDLTFLDWDLRNASNIPIAGGVYICHIDVPGVGEKVIKWFGAMRPIDLQNF